MGFRGSPVRAFTDQHSPLILTFTKPYLNSCAFVSKNKKSHTAHIIIANEYLVALAGLGLAMSTRLALNSQRPASAS